MIEQILFFIMFQLMTIIIAVPTFLSIREQFQGYQTNISDDIPIMIFVPLTIFMQFLAVMVFIE